MNNADSIDAVVQQYLDAVRGHMAHTPSERQEAVLRELREHIHEAILGRSSGRTTTLQDAYATLSELDSPEAYADAPPSVSDERRPSKKLIVLGLICSGLQIAGLAVTIAGIPVIGAIAGFAAIVSFFLIWSNKRSPRWLIWLAGVAAICGLGSIAISC
jgi:hypothetical protein